jgi:transglutaminase-like putative cysteine protease
MWLGVEHTTVFAYDEPIAEAYTELRLRPQDDGGQRCSSFRLTATPSDINVHQYVDPFGNAVHHFDVLEPHDGLTVTATSDVYAPEEFTVAARPLSLLEEHDYLTPTSYVPSLQARLSEFEPDGPRVGIFARATALMAAISSRLIYERGVTDVRTTADEVLALGRGVCQDFAHVLIGACRSAGIPARYVSGYLYDAEAEAGHAATHAWVDVFNPELGWLSLDPTHNRQQNDHYVRVAVGRDYADVPPTRGVYRGNASESLEVNVRVWAL